jgi:uncharacterized membrane protein SpoIIM required for sporulation
MEEKISLREYLYSLRFYLLFVSILFIGSIVLGYIGFFNELFSNQMGELQQLTEWISSITQPYPIWVTFLIYFAVIFLNNAFKCLLNVILGPLLGIFPLFSTFINGGLIGLVIQEWGLFVFLWILLLYGILELSAFLLSASIGLRLGREVLKRKGERNFKKELRNSLSIFLILILPLLIIAALIESALITIELLLTP